MLPPKRSTRTSIAKSIAPKRREKQPVTADECENDFKTDLSALSDSPQLVIEDGSFSSTRTYTKPEKSERRARRKLSSHQQNALEELATLGQYPSLPMRQKVAEELGLEVKVISVWFQNKRRPVNKAKGAFTKQASLSTFVQRPPCRDVLQNAKQNQVLQSSKSFPLIHSAGNQSLWDYLPSSSPDMQSVSYFSDCTSQDPDATLVSTDRRSLEWACENDMRMKKHASSSGLSTQIYGPRKRTDVKPSSPPFIGEIQSDITQTESHIDKNSKVYDEDTLEAAKVLISIRKQVVPVISCAAATTS